MRSGQTEALEVLIDGGILLDVGIGLGDVGLGLIVVVVGDEVLDGVVGEEGLELGVELRGEGLVVRNDQRGAAVTGDDVGHRKGFAAAGHPPQNLARGAALKATHQRLNRLGLVAHRRKRRNEPKRRRSGAQLVLKGDV